MAESLPVFPQFKVHAEGAVGTRWRKWVQRLENLFVGMKISDNKRRRALLLHYAGEEVYDIFDTLTDTGNDENYDQAKECLKQYFEPKVNKEYERYVFRQSQQNSDETVDQYHTRLRQLANKCEFNDNESEIKSQIIQSCTSNKLRRKALSEDMTLAKLLETARTFELAEKQASGIEKKMASGNVNKIKTKEKKYVVKQKSRPQPKRRDENPKTKCYFCGGRYPHKYECPAKGKTCSNCQKEDHFAAVCQSKPRKQTCKKIENSQTDESEDEYTFSVKGGAKQPKSKIKVNNRNFHMLIDTGSSVNIMDEAAFSKIKPKPTLNQSKTKIFAYGSSNNLKTLGFFTATIESESKISTGKFYVAKGNHGTLLGYESAVELGIIPVIRQLSSNLDKICEEYADRFQGIGKIKGVKVKIHVDESVKPTVQPHRRIPFHLRKKVETELKKLEENDIIEKVEGPTPWVSPIVVAQKPKKPDEIRMCVDMRLPNKAILRTRHITPTVDEIIHDLNGSKFFSKLDMNSGYHQLELDESSRYITTFTTHVGLRRYKRLNFGISSAAEIFQSTVSEALQGISGVKNMSDDIIVYGETEEEHDERLKAVLDRLREQSITLNKSKCEFKKQKLSFFGYIFSSDGVSADPGKIKAIKSARQPTNTSEVRSFLGMTNYVSRFIENYSTITEPLRKLTQKNVNWTWGTNQQNAFDKLKDSLTSDKVMSYYDPKKHTEVVVDASPVGLGAILTQEGKIIAYASRSLTDVEQRYSQTEREALAIIWSCEHFHLYIYGSTFSLVTDHKPLETIFNNPKSRPPARIERWRLRLQAYTFTVKYKRGVDNPADYMSRHPNQALNQSSEEKIAERFINFVAEYAVPKTISLSDIAEASTNDANIQRAIRNLRSGKWHNKTENKQKHSFHKVRNELSIANHDGKEFLLRGSRLVIPFSLQRKIVEIAHEGHQGIVKTKQLLREKVWFPGIDSAVENLCRSCVPCLATTPENKIEPLKMSPLPDSPWNEVSVDFCGPFPSGDYLLVVIDDYSRYPEVEIVHSTSARTTMTRLDKIFATHGIPQVVKTDNGPPFQSQQFRDFSKYMGFKHRKITPLWPRANGEVERFMRTIGKLIKTANIEGKNWKQEIYQFLRNYRATPHSTTGIPPATALFGRNITIRIPEVNFKKDDTKIRQRDRKQKEKMKTHADKKNQAKPSKLQKGDTVIVKQKRENKLSPPYNEKPLEIIENKGSMITAGNEDKTITRNSSAFKEVPKPEMTEITEPSDPPDEPPVSRYNLRKQITPPKYLDDYVVTGISS
ncbi:hypothetical protein FSP39_003031 [Pinctada imbricata]|uniref:RNA-directed DNA polymerase n=1 Tax=Pinctada imbricata TaxID=66713 RepID=A0AA89BYJ9_PINIB|nr:hypothetical protein FSP39_003031 [Pinctada imbricata]